MGDNTNPDNRPLDYNQEIADRICAEISDGKSLRTICADKTLPSLYTLMRWLRENEAFQKQYARSKEEQAEALVEDMLDIADESKSDWKTVRRGDQEFTVPDHEVINRSRLRVDTRKWIASKLKPKKYGEKLEIEGIKLPEPIIIKSSDGQNLLNMGIRETEMKQRIG
jgi:hypothetical protein